jgi:DNA mismatch repair protein MutH
MFDKDSATSIIDYAKKLKGQTLRKACAKSIEEHNFSGKGNFGQILEKYYFGYEPNSKAEADFVEVGIELKSSPLKKISNGDLRAKERLVLNIINYMQVVDEDFNNSSFWKKNAHLLLVFYLYDKDQELLDYVIKLVDDWKFPEEDLKVIQQDWHIINNKIKSGKAHELSEGDTFYLGACTKGSTAAKSFRNQPYSKERAKQRAYSLKQGYVNHIIANIAQEEAGTYGKLITQPKLFEEQSIEDIVTLRFQPFYGKTIEEILETIGVELNRKAKSFYANLTNAILGIGLNKKVEEFEKADIIVKTVRLKENNLPKEDISFPTFKYKEIVELDWDDSEFKERLEKKFFFVFYQYSGEQLILKKVKFWNMPYADMIEAKWVFDETVNRIKRGEADGLPKKSENRVSHVRPHAQNKQDTYETPQGKNIVKKCFWLNNSYIKDEIYLK